MGPAMRPACSATPTTATWPGCSRWSARNPGAAAMAARAWLNPWCDDSLAAADVGAPSLSRDRWDGEFAVIRTFDPR